MFLNQHNLDSIRCASKEDSKEILNGLFISEKETVATDGFQMLIVETPKDKKEMTELYPVKDDAYAITEEALKSCVLPSKSLKDVRKAIPLKSPLPVLRNLYLDASFSNKNGTAKLVANSLDNVQVFQPKKIGGDYPKYENLLPTEQTLKENYTRYTFNGRLLGEMLQTLAKMGGKGGLNVVKLHLPKTDTEKPAYMEVKTEEGQEVRALVMPVRARA